ncbi:MAG: hypothetical protein HY763_13845 [Planctomycetes bacterium]|nr:hypothetical protein [Planctomycetota bacterium]
MIEFKADCGHTVRAKDEDAGGVVRCSYCGRPANVPDSKSDELDFLFNDLQSAADKASALAPPKRRRGGMLRTAKARRTGEFNPFAVVLKLCYVAALLIIVIFVGRTWVLPLFRGEGFTRRVTDNAAATSGALPPRPTRGAPVEARPAVLRTGLVSRELLSGLYVSSTPPGATVYCVETSRAPARGRISTIQGCQPFQTNGCIPHLGDGSYVVEVVFPWNHKALSGYRDYTNFRRRIEAASDPERRQLMQQYFIPDDATEVFVDQTAEQFYLVRQYRDVEMRNQRSQGVRALFLPRIAACDGACFSVEELVNNYIPKDPAYTFDQAHVRSELEYHRVREGDVSFVVDALERIGVMPYMTPDGRTRLFKIGLEEGEFAARVLGDGKP